MRLSDMNCRRGAPMGRGEVHQLDANDAATFELERVPLTDGGYDCGGAYWGSPSDLYCYAAQYGEDEVLGFVRAASRENAKRLIEQIYPHAIFEPENGSVIEQTIAKLQEFRDTLNESVDLELVEDVDDEIAVLQEELDHIRSQA